MNDFHGLDNRLSSCHANRGPAKRKNEKLEENQVPTMEKQPDEIWQNHTQTPMKLLKEHWSGLSQYVQMCPLASQGSYFVLSFFKSIKWDSYT